MLSSHMDSRLIFSSSFILFYLLTLSFCFHSASSAILSNETDRLALLAFKAGIIDDPLGALSSWNNSIHFCRWSGITCGRRHQRVIVLNLPSLNLAGSISPYLGNLSFLIEVNLQNNRFGDEILPEVGRLRRLQILDLMNNSLVGDIPANLSSCHNLLKLWLSGNNLGGKIPLELGSLVQLEVLHVSDNNLIGNIPSSFGNMSSFVELMMASNHLSGTIPSTFGNLKNLRTFAIGDNRFEGTIPPSIFNISSMEEFDVGENQVLHGSLPSDLFTYFPKLTFFSIANNQFNGSIPSSLSNASNLFIFALNTNNLTGKVPNLKKLHKLQMFAVSENSLGFGEADDLSFLPSLNNATTLQSIQTASNNLGGVLPESICNLSRQLRVLAIDDNQIVGTIPAVIGNLRSLEVLSITSNHLSGSIPKEIGNLQKLQFLSLGGNELTGSIPSSIGNLKSLLYIYLESNKLQGSFPPSLGNCTNLLSLNITDNNINGTIPPQLFNITSLAIALDLSHNHLTGPLPIEVGNLNKLAALNVSGNRLSGGIPSSLGSCVSLVQLSLNNNFFHDSIPSSLSSLRGLDYLDLSHNNLSGQIPTFLEDLTLLNHLNLSFNNFVGMVPKDGVFKNASATSVEGNEELCGGIPEFHLQDCKFSGSAKNKRLCCSLIIIVSILLVFLAVVVIATASLLFWLRKKKEKTASSTSENSLLQVSYQTLFKATNEFSASNLIGVGSFGSVYKGTLDEDRVVAVKVFNLRQRGAFKSFIAECEAMKSIRHRNLVKVITACSSIDFHANDFKAIVYEFMVNGSLEEWLHPASESNVRSVRRNLNIVQRLNIAIDVANALDYLHYQYCQTPIVHCDLKPSNVLLDDEMTARVGDFGLVKFLSEETNYNSHIGQASSVGLRGTFGYAAPEYGIGSEVSTHGDVYSYGILILEMFSGKRPTDDIFSDNMNLHNYVKKALPQRVVDITEPMLLDRREEDESYTSGEPNQKVIEPLVLIFGIGIACSEESPTERMNISDVLARLLVIREKLTDNGARGHRVQVPRMHIS